MTHSELKRYDGRDGAKAYVAFKGTVYDVTKSPLWKEGEHEGVHNAGMDLTEMMVNAPHSDEVFKGFLVVGRLEEDPLQKQSKTELRYTFKQRLKAGYKKYHPHPMLVHFPIALHLFSAGMDLFFFSDPNESYALGVFYTFFVATIMGFAAMIPGILSWWVNYDLSRSRPFVVKLIVATFTLLLGVVAISIYLEDPRIVYERSWEGMVYHAIVLVTGLNVIILGYYGGKITWRSMPENDIMKY